jgi:hypothetical protein
MLDKTEMQFVVRTDFGTVGVARDIFNGNGEVNEKEVKRVAEHTGEIRKKITDSCGGIYMAGHFPIIIGDEKLYLEINHNGDAVLPVGTDLRTRVRTSAPGDIREFRDYQGDFKFN